MQSAEASPQHRAAILSGLLSLGFTFSLSIRVLIGWPHVAQSYAAGLAFAVGLASLSTATKVRTHWTWRATSIGLLGGIMLCLPALGVHIVVRQAWATGHGYLAWAAIAILVAASEEFFLRGALFETLQTWHGDMFATGISALAFAVLHIPLYGWHVVPLDLGVGLFLGGLRLLAGTWTAPGLAHILADLVGWWLR